MDLKSLFENDKLKGLIAVIAAVVIYYTEPCGFGDRIPTRYVRYPKVGIEVSK